MIPSVIAMTGNKIRKINTAAIDFKKEPDI